jgi:hypothetical protein
MRVVEINTTAYSDENLFIITDLTNDEIEAVIEPLVLAERNGGDEYDNEMLFAELKKAYPNNVIFEGESHYLSF